jgi:hypothetical protein
MLHDTSLDPDFPPSVSENLARCKVTVDLAGTGGDIRTFELTLDQAERFATRLRDAASALRMWSRTQGAPERP